MDDEDIVRRLEQLEDDVRTLMAALESVIDWKMTALSSSNVHQQRPGAVVVHGQERTRRILAGRTRGSSPKP